MVPIYMKKKYGYLETKNYNVYDWRKEKEKDNIYHDSIIEEGRN